MCESIKPLMYDDMTGRYFRATVGDVRAAFSQALFHAEMDGEFLSLNTFYDLLGLPSMSLGEIMGWRVSDLLANDREPSFGAMLTSAEEPAVTFWIRAKIHHIDGLRNDDMRR